MFRVLLQHTVKLRYFGVFCNKTITTSSRRLQGNVATMKVVGALERNRSTLTDVNYGLVPMGRNGSRMH